MEKQKTLKDAREKQRLPKEHYPILNYGAVDI